MGKLAKASVKAGIIVTSPRQKFWQNKSDLETRRGCLGDTQHLQQRRTQQNKSASGSRGIRDETQERGRASRPPGAGGFLDGALAVEKNKFPMIWVDACDLEA
ncbi:hypothetical protein BaRGS_00019086 [Batillaria attramentaria]|uniref:Uncharacterized protein n=1 Tax=Batillaria attramentaria TaxID=370345 RepID=A0ABD0KRF0_9CAEN